MMTKKISKVIIYYEDGTYEEVKAGVSDSQNKQNKEFISPSPVMPDLRPDYYKIREWNTPQWVPNTDPQPPWIVTCQSGNVPLNYTVSSDHSNMETWKFTSTGNTDNLNKYTITSTGNGINVDLSK
jgi:hypothetical protein